MKNFKIYYLNKDYYNILERTSNQFEKKDTRPNISYLGFKINDIDYLIPLTSDSQNKYKQSHKYSLPIYNTANQEKLGVLLINKMIPVMQNKHFCYEPSINQIAHDHDINKIKLQLNYLNQNHMFYLIHQLANEVYKYRYNATEEKMLKDNNLKFAVDFKQAEILMFKYAFELYDANLLDEEPLIPEHIANESLYEFSKLDQYCFKNNITDENRFCIYESDAYEIELLKHENGDLELVEEIWDGEEDGPDGKILYYRPYINKLNGIAKKWSIDEISQMTKDELIEDIKNNLGWVDEMWDAMEEGEEEFKEELSEYFDKWNLFNKPSQQQKR